ncbi:exopolyphosphatase [Curvibacter sp. RS43]|uniref:exopolyphosphatase n=1 Tax=Curvibacter microcysteis TaxID=3026419 RepID=UPI0023611595|nr:exopolyphosphatase [Curvibacter sp. RS43]MDD0809083.1 exopolyphosphatase [Curvibacter sp. RS43]
MQNGTLIAAVDLGSNSFRLEIGRLVHGQIQRSEYLKETVRQGSGLDEERRLTPEAMQRGWDCLARFAERLAGFSATQVRAVATQTLREARNRDDFIKRANDILGFPIDVISGPEEARLIYQGVARLLPQSDERRLVVDIGGRSTELILGQQYHANVVASYRVGSVAWSMKYFPQGQFTQQAFMTAEIAAKAVLDEALDSYRRDSWDVAYGSSGTVGAVADVLAAAGEPAGRISRSALGWLQERLLRAQSADRVRMEGLKDERRAVIGGGVSVLTAIFDLLGIDEMQVAQGALRQGVLYDLLDREQAHTDLRASTVLALSERFQVDAAQAERVREAALTLYQQIEDPVEERAERKLGWAAQLHEIGQQIAHSDYHRHGAYILDNTDAPGFSLPELHRLGQLILGHRGKVRKLEADLGDEDFVRQLLCLRLAVALCHARRSPDLASLKLSQTGAQFSLSASAAWCQQFPQSAHLMREEALAWQKTPWSLLFQQR